MLQVAAMNPKYNKEWIVLNGNALKSGPDKWPHILTPTQVKWFKSATLENANNGMPIYVCITHSLLSGLHLNAFRMPEVREATWCLSLSGISSDLVYWLKTHTVLIIALSLLKDIFSLPLSGHIGTNNLLTKEETRQAQLAELLSSFEAAWAWFIVKMVWFSLIQPQRI